MIQIRDVSLSLEGNEIFKNISLDLSLGSILHIDGKNGSGKTSLLKCITGIYSDFNGDIKINSHAVSRHTVNNYTPFLSFFIDKGFSYPFLTIEQNLKIFKYYNGNTKVNVDLDELTREFGLYKILKERVFKISAGSKQKLELVLALINDGQYVLLDEPTVNLDNSSIEILYNYIVKTSESNNKAYLIVSHNDVKVAKIASQKLSL